MMKSYRLLIIFIVSFCLLWNAIYYSVPVIDWVLLPFSLFFTFNYVKKFNILKDMASTLVLLCLFLSVVFVATFQIAGNKYGYNNYSLLAPFANRLYFEFAMFSCLFLNFRRGKGNKRHYYEAQRLSDRKIKLIFLITFFVLTVGYFTGALRMDSMWDTNITVLPFHLNGVIYVFAQVVASRLFVVIIENEYLTAGKINKNHIIMMIFLGLYGSFTSMSKGLMFYYIGLPMLALFIFFRPRLSFILRYGVPVILMLVLLYPIVGEMRSYKDSNISITEKILNAQSSSSENKGKDAQYNNAFEATFNRVFMSGSYYMNAYPHLNHSEWFDFSRVPFIVLNGGVSFIITHEVDGFPIDYPHNSASTGILDALFIGGYGFCYIIMFFIVALASAVDSSKLQEMVSIRIMLTLLVFDLLSSSISEPFIVPQYWIRLIGVVLTIYAAKKINFRKVLTPNKKV